MRPIGASAGRLAAAGDIALADVGGQLHVERRALVEVADHEVGVGDLDVARGGDHARGDFGRAGAPKVQPLGAFAFHLERDLLHVEHDVGDVLADAREAREFVQHAVDLDRGDGGALERRRAARGEASCRASCRSRARAARRRNGAAAAVAAPCLRSSALGFLSSCQFFALTAMFLPGSPGEVASPP